MTTLYPISAIALTPEEEAIFRTEYEKYLALRIHHPHGVPMSFDDWWRAAADNAKDRAKYKD